MQEPQTQDLLPEPTRVKRRRPPRTIKEFATVTLLKELFEKEGYLIEQFRGGQTPNFRITSLTEPERWGWVIDPETDTMVRRPRDLTLEQWRGVVKYNVKRLNMTKIAGK
ncbi:TPA: hypothetical protein JD836_14490 [Citrobacter freundii]|nr:hypothetical protein [Citrobacter freundii]HCD1268005.1 hypothetical protein [Citrobacter freundii]